MFSTAFYCQKGNKVQSIIPLSLSPLLSISNEIPQSSVFYKTESETMSAFVHLEMCHNHVWSFSVFWNQTRWHLSSWALCHLDLLPSFGILFTSLLSITTNAPGPSCISAFPTPRFDHFFQEFYFTSLTINSFWIFLLDRVSETGTLLQLLPKTPVFTDRD